MARRALFIKTKNLGDAVVMTAAIQALPPDYLVQVLCFEDCADVYSGMGRIEKLWTVGRGRRGLAAIKEGLALFRNLRHFDFDLLCQFSDDWRGAFLARFLRVKLSVAGQSTRRPDLWHQSFKVIARRSNVARRHAAELDVDLLRAARIFTGEAPPYLGVGQSSPRLADDAVLKAYGLRHQDYVVFHLASRWSFKELSVETARDLIRDLAAEYHHVVLTGSESDRNKLEALLQGTQPDNLISCIGASIPVFSAILKQAIALVSIDSFAVHLASAHAVPIVAIFGPSGELNWRPWRTPHRVVTQTELYPCRPCGQDGCAGSKVSECLRTLSTRKIIASLRELIEETQAQQSSRVPR
jgi:heptosyltransferase-3